MAALGAAEDKMPDNVALREWHQVANDEYFYDYIFRSWKIAGTPPATLVSSMPCACNRRCMCLHIQNHTNPHRPRTHTHVLTRYEGGDAADEEV